jgi:hypothetical protein
MAGAPHGVQINVNHIRGGQRTYTAQSLIGCVCKPQLSGRY